MFFTLFVIGAVGFGAMLFLSFGHFGGGHHPFHGAARAGHLGARVGIGRPAQLGVKAGLARPAAVQQAVRGAKGPAPQSAQAGGLVRWIPWQYLLVTPLDIFAFCLGMGGGGLVLTHFHFVSGSALITLAVLAGLLYNYALIRPVIGFVLKFASRESTGLEGTVAATAEALSHFDAAGRGIVRLTLDGQFIQLLATLDAAEFERGVTVARGDTLMVLEVDAKRNTCRVSRDLAA